MKIDIKQHPTEKDKAEITIWAKPVKIISIEGQVIELEWENMRWKTKIPGYFGVVSIDEEIKNIFIEKVNQALSWIGEDTKRCPMCHQKFLHSEKGRRRIYCSDKCRMRASRERREKKQDATISLDSRT